MLTCACASQPRFLFLAGIIASATVAAGASSPTPETSKTSNSQVTRIAASYGKLPLSFEANRGQADEHVKFISRGGGYSLLLTGSGAVLALTGNQVANHPDSRLPGRGRRPGAPGPKVGIRDKAIAAGAGTGADVIRMELAGANKNAQVAGANQLPGISNYFIGNDPAQWRTGVPTYAKVRYTAVYPGIDLLFHGNQRQLEYDFLVAPGANPQDIRLQFDGAKGLRIADDGDLVVKAEGGVLAFHKPVVYQVVGGQQKPIEGAFALLPNHAVGFRLGSYNHAQPLVIDPVLEYSTYLGGTGDDHGYGLAVDSQGCAYVTGMTTSTNFPVTANGFQQKLGSANGNVFVAKLNQDGTELVYSTFLGGSGSGHGEGGGDSASAVAVDQYGNAYLTGYSNSTNFPTTKGAFQTVNTAALSANSNAFVTKLNPTGSALVYSTFLGGSANDVQDLGDFAREIVVDSSGDAFIAGTANSTDFPVTKGAFQTKYKTSGNSAAFVAEFNPTGTKLVFSTLLGGSSTDDAFGLALDSQGDVYLTGSAWSSDFPLKNPYQSKNGAPGESGGNAFVTKLNPTGKALIYSTYLGGNGGTGSVLTGDAGYGIAVDSEGNAYVTGSACSPNFPVTKGAFQTANGDATTQDDSVFVSKFNPAGSDLVYSTLIGGSSGDQGNSIVVDGAGNTYLTGSTYSGDFPITPDAVVTINAAIMNNNAGVAFVTKLNPTGTALLYSTFLGGAGNSTYGDVGMTIVQTETGKTYVAGFAASTNFPVTPGAFQTKNRGEDDAFVSEFALGSETADHLATLSNLTASATKATTGQKLTFTFTPQPVSGKAALTGPVAFYMDLKKLCTVALDNTGKAVYSTASLPAGSHLIAAYWPGDSGYAGTASGVDIAITVPVTAAPTFKPVAGTYPAAQTVTLSSTTGGAAFYYTTNGTKPTASSTKYTSAGIRVAASETVKAIAVASGYSPSAVASASYTIATAPAVTTQAATGITASSAVLHGTVTANDAKTQYWFTYGTSSASLTSATAKTGALTGATATPVTATLTSLNANTTYYFKAVASNAAGTTNGDVLSFKTK